MKSKLYIIASILAVLCLICSCANGGSGSEEDTQKTVAVSFAVDGLDTPAKVITVRNPDVMGQAVYQYKASANFTSEFGTPQGTQTTWKDLTMSGFNSTDTDLYFAQGSWTFQVRVILKGQNYNAETGTPCTLLYQTAQEGVTQYINASSKTVSANVTKQIDNSANGTLFVNGISTPDTSGADKLVVSYGPIGGAQSVLATITDPEISAGRSTFTKNGITVAPGIYAMTFTLKDSSDNEVGASTKTVEILKEQTTPVTGAMDAGKWVAAGFAIKGIKTIEATLETDDVSVTKGTPVVFDITGTIKESGVATNPAEAVTFYFYPGNGLAGSSITLKNGQYSWATTDVPRGNYTVSLIATDAAGTLVTSPASLNIIVK